MRVLLTGASGFIGKRLAMHLSKRGDEVLAIGRTPCPVRGVRNLLAPRLDLSSLEDAFEAHSVDSIFHLAAAGVRPDYRDTADLIDINVLLPTAIVAAASRHAVTSVTLIGSCAEYAAELDLACDPSCEGTQLNERSACETRRIYGATKAAGTLLGLSTGATFGIPVIAARLFQVYGPGEPPHRLLSTLAAHLTLGRDVPLSLGTQVRDFVFVDDVCESLTRLNDALSHRTVQPGIYNICTGRAHSVAQFSYLVAQKLGVDSGLLKFGAIPLRSDDLPFVVGDPRKLRTSLGWQPGTSLAAGIEISLRELAVPSISRT
jgi:nucleoside-diphosphate-sugar epimerase